MKNLLKKISKKPVIAFVYCITAKFSFAQTFTGDDIQQQFTAYQLNNYAEKLFVHIDKTFYIAGEMIWFKVYCVDERFNKLSEISKIVYIEIINADNKPVLQAKIALNGGMGNGSFIIPSYIASGNYIFRAYTKWMENADAAYFFHSPVTIVNTLKASAFKNEAQEKSYAVSFFPEGGNLVAGITSEVAFKAVNKNGEAAGCSGIITDANNNTLTSFSTLKFGTCNFNFMPKENETYKAVIKFTDTTITSQLPPVYKQGFVMHAENTDEAHIKISVTTNIPAENTAYLLVHARNMLKDFQKSAIANGKGFFVVNRDKLTDGINIFTIFNADKQPVCERLYFKNPSSFLNIQLQADKTGYSLRDNVKISLATTNKDIPVNADMSAAVFMVDSLQSEDYTDIRAYLLLSSELKGYIPSPAFYFQNTKEAETAADNLMLTQGWRRFKWEDILQNKKPYFEFLPEYEGFIINGKITNRYTGAAAPNKNVLLSAPGTNFQLASTQSDADGNLRFNIKNFYGSDNIITQADSNFKIEITSPFSNNYNSVSVPPFLLPTQWKNQLLYRSINAQAENDYLIEKKQHAFSYDTEDTSLFYGNPDKRYNLDDYTRFTTMEEVMREYVAEVNVRKEGTNYHFKLENLPITTFFNSDPLMLIDGVPVSNTNSIIAFDPLKIKRLDVVARKYYYGNIVTDGIVSYFTYDGDLAGFPLNADNIVIKFDGLQREREFYAPVYNSEQTTGTHIPDFRNVLYWSPKLKTGADGKTGFDFYTSDIAGKFACVVQGLASNGTAGSSIITFNVTDKK